jgi:hypothetical protein
MLSRYNDALILEYREVLVLLLYILEHKKSLNCIFENIEPTIPHHLYYDLFLHSYCSSNYIEPTIPRHLYYDLFLRS